MGRLRCIDCIYGVCVEGGHLPGVIFLPQDIRVYVCGEFWIASVAYVYAFASGLEGKGSEERWGLCFVVRNTSHMGSIGAGRNNRG